MKISEYVKIVRRCESEARAITPVELLVDGIRYQHQRQDNGHHRQDNGRLWLLPVIGSENGYTFFGEPVEMSGDAECVACLCVAGSAPFTDARAFEKGLNARLGLEYRVSYTSDEDGEHNLTTDTIDDAFSLFNELQGSATINRVVVTRRLKGRVTIIAKRAVYERNPQPWGADEIDEC